ncbi:hypothetical protein BC830DRAFT_885305 [Chytriomyces sp. MP71]|nr:hypothetical protein BC830DRAFT_885305 [Chytriomyces sp. MP71]
MSLLAPRIRAGQMLHVHHFYNIIVHDSKEKKRGRRPGDFVGGFFSSSGLNMSISKAMTDGDPGRLRVTCLVLFIFMHCSLVYSKKCNFHQPDLFYNARLIMPQEQYHPAGHASFSSPWRIACNIPSRFPSLPTLGEFPPFDIQSWLNVVLGLLLRQG